ncbi:P-loop containing nucleoside triphosphate hydrolase protein, partial [Mycena epipterygia]
MSSSQAPHNSATSSTPTTTGTTPRPLGSSSESKTNWLANSLLTAKIVTAAADSVPLPYVKGVFGTVVVLLETVEKLKKNRDDLKDLCEDVMEIIDVVQGLSTQQDTPAVQFKKKCDEFQGALQIIVAAVKKMQTKPKGLRGHLKEIIKLGSTTDAISGYRSKMQELRLNFMLMNTTDTNLRLRKVQESFAAMPFNASGLRIAENTNNCPSPSRIFEGRRAILDGMHQYFFQATGKQHIYLLYGLGGAGKTQIALKFIKESSSHFTDTFFIDTSNKETIDTALKNIALAKNVGSTSQDALQWLRNKQDEWLLFFDNADDPKLNLNDFIPQCNHGNILITSRNHELRAHVGAHWEISDMEEEDAVDLLLKSAKEPTTPGNRKTAAEIVKVLSYLPLAIIQAGAFILKSGALNTYLALYATNKERLLREKPAQSHDNYAWTVYTTWQISFNQLSEPAATLLQLCSFLHHEGISEQIFSHASAYEFKSYGPSEEELQKALEFLSHFLGQTGVWDSLHFMDLITELRAYSLITFNVMKQLFSIHPLVHDWSRTTLTHKESYHRCMIAIVGMSIAQIPWGNIEVDSLRLLPHLDALLNGNMHLTLDFEAEYGKIYHHSQKHRQAEKLRAIVLEKEKTILGEDHPDTLTAIYNLANTYQALGKLEEAEKLQVVVVDKRKTVLGEDHPDTLNAMNNLASTYHALGKLEEAEKLQVVVLEKRKTVSGEDHPDTL